jgi:hypothetical protein
VISLHTAVALTGETAELEMISRETIRSAVNIDQTLIENNSYMSQVTIPSIAIDMYD